MRRTPPQAFCELPSPSFIPLSFCFTYRKRSVAVTIDFTVVPWNLFTRSRQIHSDLTAARYFNTSSAGAAAMLPLRLPIIQHNRYRTPMELTLSHSKGYAAQLPASDEIIFRRIKTPSLAGKEDQELARLARKRAINNRPAIKIGVTITWRVTHWVSKALAITGSSSFPL